MSNQLEIEKHLTKKKIKKWSREWVPHQQTTASFYISINTSDNLQAKCLDILFDNQDNQSHANHSNLLENIEQTYKIDFNFILIGGILYGRAKITGSRN